MKHLAWPCLLLITLVAFLNLAAILIRGKLRKKFVANQF